MQPKYLKVKIKHNNKKMEKENNKFWSYNTAKSVIASAIIFAGLPFFFLVLHFWLGWPHTDSVTVILIGIFILGILPILLALLDIIVERGGKVELKYFAIDLSKFTQNISPGITIPANIGIRGTAVYDSDTVKILDALKESKKSDVIVIDIEDGKAWWETRLLVLLSGAVRVGTPDKIVFRGTILGQEQTYIGWGYASELFEKLLPKNSKYEKAYFASKAAAKQWELIEPLDPSLLSNIILPFQFGLVAGSKQNLVFDPQTGLPNEYVQEQILQSLLGLTVETFEQASGTLNITHGKLIDLFNDVLKKDQLDETWTKEEQVRVFFQNDLPYFTLTNNGKYLRMVSRLSIINEMFKNVVLNDRDKK